MFGADGLPVVGTSVHHLYNALYERDFKFIRTHSASVTLPSAKHRAHDLFMGVCFGRFSSTGPSAEYGRLYERLLNPEKVAIDETSFISAYHGDAVTPLRICGMEFRQSSFNFSHSTPRFFLLDPTRTLDLIEFWNLRALGWTVTPLPLQYLDSVLEYCSEYVTRHYQPHRSNPKLFQHVSLLHAHSVTQDQAQSFIKRLTLPGREALLYQRWYPRIWEEFGREADGIRRGEVEADRSYGEVTCTDNDIRIDLLQPTFAERAGWSKGCQWANVIAVSDYRAGSRSARLLLPGLSDVDTLLRASHWKAIASTSEGIVVYSSTADDALTLRIPDGSRCFAHWLGQLGFKMQTSTAGETANQLIRALGGIHGARILAHHEVIKKLHDMAHIEIEREFDGSDERPLLRLGIERATKWIGLLESVYGDRAAAVGHLKQLIDRGALELGLAIECYHCKKRNWYAVDNLGVRLECRACLQAYEFPSEDVRRVDWNYRSRGPFSVEGYGRGSWTVALSLRFFLFEHLCRFTWAPSFEVVKDGQCFEFDFGMWWKDETRNMEPSILLGECKSYSAFQARDVRKVLAVSRIIGPCCFVFATLRKELDKKEQQLLASLARSLRRRGQQQVMVLTATELLTHSMYPTCWKEKGGLHAGLARLAHIVRHDRTPIDQLCDSTQQLYLGLPSYDDQLLELAMRARGQHKGQGEKLA